MKKAIKGLAWLVIVATGLSLYGYAAHDVSSGGKALGVFAEPFRKFVTAPKVAMDVFRDQEFRGIPVVYTEADPDFEPVNRLSYDLYGLNSFYNRAGKRWDIRLFNFKDDALIHEWRITMDQAFLRPVDRKFSTAPPKHSLLLPDWSVVVHLPNTFNLFRLDKNSNVIWHNTSRYFHHSLNLDAESNIWACASSIGRIKHFTKGWAGYFRDDYITKLALETGEILFEKSVCQILIENGYKSLAYGMNNSLEKLSGEDPMHLNDIEPTHSDTEHWLKGDLFLSIRHRSLIIHYRPSENKVIRLLSGPFLNQHDVDILSDSEISLFDNNIRGLSDPISAVEELGECRITDSLGPSGIVVYNFKDSTYRRPMQHHFESEAITTWTEGLHAFLANGDLYVEAQNSGKMYIMNEDEIVLKKVFPTDRAGMVERPTWMRLYENLDFLK